MVSINKKREKREKPEAKGAQTKTLARGPECWTGLSFLFLGGTASTI
jgi:hypothetical protein